MLTDYRKMKSAVLMSTCSMQPCFACPFAHSLPASIYIVKMKKEHDNIWNEVSSQMGHL